MQKQRQRSQQSNCLGCRTYFEQSETLPLQCHTIEYKNFLIPLTENKQKWTLLKTIVSFMNTKGGTIFIGVEDSNCKVVGKQMSSKLRDDFKLYLLQLVQRVQPQIDLIVKQEIIVQYVPVLKANNFTGKYIIKILVKQGDSNQTYCFSQKIQWALQGKKQIQNQCENVQIVYAYVRHNMGGAKQIKGMKLIEQAIKKAQNPPPKYNTFHEQCNPEPPCLQVEIRKIGFKNLGNREARRKFQRLFQEQLQKLQTQFQIVYDTEFKAVIIELQTAEQFKRINNFIRANLSILNESQDEVRFVEQGDYLDVHFYQNSINKNNVQQDNSPTKQKSQKNSQQNNKKQPKMEQKPQKKVQPKRKQEKIVKQERSETQTEAQDGIYSLTFTHINPHIKDKLLNYLTLSISKKIHILTETYQNTIDIFFSCPEDLQKYSLICTQPNHLKALQSFGFNNEIRIGYNTGRLHILNYDKSKQHKFVSYLKSLIGKELKQIQVLKRGNRYIVDCRMVGKGLACQWLDKLLTSKPFKQFRIPGAQNGAAPKMKVFIHCDEIKI